MASRKMFFLLVTGLVLSACAPAPATTQAATSVPSAIPTAQEQVAATFTAVPSETTSPLPEPSPTDTPTPTLTPEPTQLAQFESFEIIAVEQFQFTGPRITVRLPSIQVPLNLYLNGSLYYCDYEMQYPDRLFCNGFTLPEFETVIKARLMSPETNEMVFEKYIELHRSLLMPDRSQVRTIAHTPCPQAGQNVGCETECRIDYDGNPCLIATCFDACGPYYTVATCPELAPPWTFCNEETANYLKGIYGIP